MRAIRGQGLAVGARDDAVAVLAPQRVLLERELMSHDEFAHPALTVHRIQKVSREGVHALVTPLGTSLALLCIVPSSGAGERHLHPSSVTELGYLFRHQRRCLGFSPYQRRRFSRSHEWAQFPGFRPTEPLRTVLAVLHHYRRCGPDHHPNLRQ